MKRIVLLAAASMAAACVQEPSLSSTADRQSFADWLAPHLTGDGRYSVQGDIVTDDLGLLERIYEQENPMQGALAIADNGGAYDRWSSRTQRSITYCISAAFGAQKNLIVQGMKDATGGWESSANVNVIRNVTYDEGTCTDSTTQVVFNVRYFDCDDPEDYNSLTATERADNCDNPTNGHIRCGHLTNNLGDPNCAAPFAGRSFFPDQTNRAYRQLLIGSVRSLPDQGATDALLRHETGHILGFIHEFSRADSPATCPHNTEASWNLTPYDVNSVMQYSQCNGNAPRTFFTGYDLEGVASVYGNTVNYDVFAGDFNGDGITDLGVRSGVGGNLMISTTVTTSATTTWNIFNDGYGSTGTQMMIGKYHDTATSDVAIKEDSTGTIYIDYGYNGFNGWDASYGGYGFSNAIVAQADYDGDGYTDLSIKDTSGNWYIDYSSIDNSGYVCAARPCFGGWNAIFSGYGDSTAAPVPADYDGDGRADLAVKTTSGGWYIDYSNINNGGGSCTTILPCFGGWNLMLSGYGGTNVVPTPADYDGDHRADLSIKDTSGYWYIDYSSVSNTGGACSAPPCFGGWNFIGPGYGDGNWKPVPGHWHAGSDTTADIAAKRVQGTTTDLTWGIDRASTGFGTYDAILTIQE